MPEFDKFATDYKEVLDASVALSGESGEYFAQVKARYVATIIPKDFNGKLLDYGCGVGTLSNCLQVLLPEAHLNGFDVSAESITTINCNLASRGLFTNDSAKLGAGYNVIILSNVLHHIDPPDRSSTIQELKARLCGDGLLIVFEHNPINPLTRWVVRNSPLDENAILLYRGEVLTLLSSIEMSVLRTSYLLFFPRVLSSMRFLEDYLQWCPLGAQYAVVARQGRC